MATAADGSLLTCLLISACALSGITTGLLLVNVRGDSLWMSIQPKLTSAPRLAAQPLIAVPALFAAPLSARARLVRSSVSQKISYTARLTAS